MSSESSNSPVVELRDIKFCDNTMARKNGFAVCPKVNERAKIELHVYTSPKWEMRINLKNSLTLENLKWNWRPYTVTSNPRVRQQKQLEFKAEKTKEVEFKNITYVY